MTDDMMNVRSLVEKSADADLLREMIGFVAERLMALEIVIGESSSQRCDDLKDCRPIEGLPQRPALQPHHSSAMNRRLNQSLQFRSPRKRPFF
jgi:hypothetical protein